jgi:hypothetical protein
VPAGRLVSPSRSDHDAAVRNAAPSVAVDVLVSHSREWQVGPGEEIGDRNQGAGSSWMLADGG